MKVDVIDEVDEEWWNGLLAPSCHGNIFQAYNWGAFLREYMGYGIVYIVCSDSDGQIRGMLQVSVSCPGHSHLLERPFGGAAIRLLKSAYPVYSWQGGPVLFGPCDEWEQVLRLILSALISIVGRGRIGSFVLPHGAERHMPPELANHFQMRLWATYVIDLMKSEGELWDSLKSSSRKSIRRAERDGIRVERLFGEQERRDFQGFRRECLRIRGARCYSVDNLLVRYRWLNKTNSEDIFVAKSGDNVISSLGVLRFNGQVSEFGSNQSRLSFEKKLYGNDLIKWTVLRHERENGSKLFDLSGVNPNPATDKEKNIVQFKKKWGGRYQEYPIYAGR